MRPTLLSLAAACALLFATAAQATITIDWLTVADPGNIADPATGYGAVDYTYRVSKHETTSEQYVAFLNAVAATDTYGLYETAMTSDPNGGVTRIGTSGSYSYTVKPGFADRPAIRISWLRAARFANWMENGQPTGAQDNSTTEDGSYTITAQSIADNSITRNPGSTYTITSEDEWYKAAYYDPIGEQYFLYPCNDPGGMTCQLPGATPNSANCGNVLGTTSDVGAYTASASPYGTFDQGGNLWEWNETIEAGGRRGLRAGRFDSSNGPNPSASINRDSNTLAHKSTSVGFRLSATASNNPVPGLGLPALGMLLFVMAGVGSLALRATRRA